MKRYYIEQTGYDFDSRLSMGILLNEDGTEYTGDMNAIDQPYNSKDIQEVQPTFSVDGCDIKIKPVSEDTAYLPYAKATLVFWQGQNDSKQVVASVSLQVHELEKLKKTIDRKLDDLRSGK
jgi:hypothetical protein